MRQKTAPKMIDMENFVPSQFTQDPFAQSQQQPQQQWEDVQIGTQSTSTPIFPRQSQSLFGSANRISPISFDDSFISGDKSDQYEYNYQSQNKNGRNRSVQSAVSGYQSDQVEYEYQPQNKNGRNRSVQSVVSGFQADQGEYGYQSQNLSEINRTSQGSGYQSGGVDRFNSINHTRGGRIKKRVIKRKQGVAIDREIRELQRTTNSLLKMAPFSRIVKETISK
uniref:BHLH domain-containing protein n=1 Tax=Panagrolaimus superbus TaxID=310955 RepID=A0A914Y2Z3_9BILA